MREIAEFFSTLLAVIVIIKSWSDFRANRESWQMFVFWSVVWIGVAIVAFFPGTIDILLQKIGGERSGVGTVLSMGMVFVLFVIYRIYVKMERIERELTKLIKDIAIKEIARKSKLK